jgi:hypothetical protein
MAKDRSNKHLPPYVSYRTFCNFIEGMRQQMPARIDRSFWSSTLSGSNGTQLMAAFRFLGLIDTGGRPTAQLKSLVSAKGEQRTTLLKDIATGTFGFVFQGSLDPQNATYAQLEEVFHETFQCTGDVARKCIKFFISLSNDAGIPLSPFITKRTKPVYSHSAFGTSKPKKRSGIETIRNFPIPQSAKEALSQTSWNEMLLTKFPSFDPAWSDEVKLKWFAAFDELLKHRFSEGRGSN